MKLCFTIIPIILVWAAYIYANGAKPDKKQKQSISNTSKTDQSEKVNPVAFNKVNDFLINNCLECHDNDIQEGDINLDQFPTLTGNARVNLLSKVEEQLYLKNMPPKKKDPITEKDHNMITKWIDHEYERINAQSVFKQKMRKAKYGNYISHKKLFSGEIKEKAWSPARRWIISPYIYNQRIKEIVNLSERDLHSKSIRRFLLNPFSLSDKDSVQYYDNENLGDGHLSTIFANAQWIGWKQIEKFLIASGKVEARRQHTGGNSYANEWNFETTQILKDIISSKNGPTDNQLKIAIKDQFKLALRRAPSTKELTKFLNFTKRNIKLGGVVKGLKNMLVSVFLEEEIYYRSEFGIGKPDKYGRKLLSPIEAAYAITYALKDTSPDKALIIAAKEGRLASRDDFKREIERMLADKTNKYPVDEELYHHRYDIANPRILRFFRDFFGYPKTRKLFKDNHRFWGGNYLHVPKTLVKEADMLMEHWLVKDKNVFENMLGSDKYYVFHDGDNAKTTRKVKGLKKAFKRLLKSLKGLDWQKNPDAAFVKAGLLKATPDKKKPRARRDRRSYHLNKLIIRAESAEASVAKGFKPVPFKRYDMRIRQAHVYNYNIDINNWDYPPVQPHPLPNRKGILTHPAWLIAKSTNTANDPVHRGLWIQKNLLAGYVLDVPITVDAVIPEHKDKGLNERLTSATKKKECWRCHDKMNPLGIPFEEYDDFGVFRKMESLEHIENIIKKGTLKPNVPNTYKKTPVNPTSILAGTGNKSLDGKVSSAVDLVEKLSKSATTRQSIIRHAFRYFMGRNEMLSDSQTLIDADNAYMKSGGSFNAVVLSLLTSDSFIYRK